MSGALWKQDAQSFFLHDFPLFSHRKWKRNDIFSDMRKTAVTFSSRYGSSRLYAQEFARQMNLPIVSLETIDEDTDILVYFGGLYAGNVRGLAKCIRHLPSQTRLVLVTVGIADPDDETNRNNIMKTVARQTETVKERCTVLHLRGALDYTVMSVRHRLMMKALVTMIRKKGNPSEEDRMIVSTSGERTDYTDLRTLEKVKAALLELTEISHS